MSLRWLVLAAAILLGSCAGGPIEATTTAASASTTKPSSTTTTLSPTTTTTATTDPASTTTTVPAYDLIIEGGTDEVPEVTIHGPEQFDYRLGDAVEITVLSSVDDELHVHGYNLFFDLVAGEVTVVSLEATIPGIFEAEMEGRQKLVFELQVTP